MPCKLSWDAISAIASILGAIASIGALAGVWIAWKQLSDQGAAEAEARQDVAKAYVASVLPQLADARRRIAKFVAQIDTALGQLQEDNKAQTLKSVQTIFAGPFQNMYVSVPLQLYIQNAESLRKEAGGPHLAMAYAAYEQLRFTAAAISNRVASERSTEQVREELQVAKQQFIALDTSMDSFAHTALAADLHPAMSTEEWRRSSTP
jgi:hypothetical protein